MTPHRTDSRRDAEYGTAAAPGHRSWSSQAWILECGFCRVDADPLHRDGVTLAGPPQGLELAASQPRLWFVRTDDSKKARVSDIFPATAQERWV
jgi:hypothetical protein